MTPEVRSVFQSGELRTGLPNFRCPGKLKHAPDWPGNLLLVLLDREEGGKSEGFGDGECKVCGS